MKCFKFKVDSVGSQERTFVASEDCSRVFYCITRLVTFGGQEVTGTAFGAVSSHTTNWQEISSPSEYTIQKAKERLSEGDEQYPLKWFDV